MTEFMCRLWYERIHEREPGAAVIGRVEYGEEK